MCDNDLESTFKIYYIVCDDYVVYCATCENNHEDYEYEYFEQV